MRGSWDSLLDTTRRRRLLDVLEVYIQERRWYRSKTRTVRNMGIRTVIPAQINGQTVQILLVDIDFTEGEPETYILPLAFATDERAEQVQNWTPHAVVAEITAAGEAGVIYDGLWENDLSSELLDLISRQRTLRGDHGRIRGTASRSFKNLRGSGDLHPVISGAEQSNTSVILGDRLMLKIFRKVEEGINPDYEVGRFLTERTTFDAVAPVAGAIEYEPARGASMTLGLLLGYVENEGDAWAYTLDVLGSFIERLLSEPELVDAAPVPARHLLDVASNEIPGSAYDFIGTYLDDARRLGEQTGNMHLALASREDDAAFRPEDFSLLGQRALYQSMRSQSRRNLRELQRIINRLPEALQADARELAEREDAVIDRFQQLTDHRIDAQSIRTHGDYHLGQVLYTGRDFVIIDFEGEPARPIGERRIKRSPLRDVAGMLRSFDYAASSGLMGTGAWVRDEDMPRVSEWSRLWYHWVSGAFLQGYLETVEGASFLPSNEADLRLLLDAYLIEKAIYEIGYEINNRPDWTAIPVRGILNLLEEQV